MTITDKRNLIFKQPPFSTTPFLNRPSIKFQGFYTTSNTLYPFFNNLTGDFLTFPIIFIIQIFLFIILLWVTFETLIPPVILLTLYIIYVSKFMFLFHSSIIIMQCCHEPSMTSVKKNYQIFNT